MSDFTRRLEYLSGYKASARASDSTFTLANDGDQYRILTWPTDNPPTIAEIESVELPEVTPAPDWAAFRLALVQSSAYLRITSAAPNALVALLTNIAFLIDSQPEKAVELAAIWNAIATLANPTSEEIAALNTIGTVTNVPFALNASGLME
jgi:hypothetical protein